jgi:hypothetical protein
MTIKKPPSNSGTKASAKGIIEVGVRVNPTSLNREAGVNMPLKFFFFSGFQESKSDGGKRAYHHVLF